MKGPVEEVCIGQVSGETLAALEKAAPRPA